jgi:two-component system OmpR family response regulator
MATYWSIGAAMTQHSMLSIFSHNAALHGQVAACLAPFFWSCHQALNEETAVAHVRDDDAAIILFDGDIGIEAVNSTIRQIRALLGFAAGIPTILLAEADFESVGGLSDRMDPPLDSKGIVAAIENWVGPIDNHGFRHAENPQYRMMRLAGRERAALLFSGFAQSLADALRAIDEGQSITRVAHNIAGMAGTMGYTSLSRQWSAVDHGDMSALPAARDAALSVLNTLKASA